MDKKRFAIYLKGERVAPTLSFRTRSGERRRIHEVDPATSLLLACRVSKMDCTPWIIRNQHPIERLCTGSHPKLRLVSLEFWQPQYKTVTHKKKKKTVTLHWTQQKDTLKQKKKGSNTASPARILNLRLSLISVTKTIVQLAVSQHDVMQHVLLPSTACNFSRRRPAGELSSSPCCSPSAPLYTGPAGPGQEHAHKHTRTPTHARLTKHPPECPHTPTHALIDAESARKKHSSPHAPVSEPLAFNSP